MAYQNPQVSKNSSTTNHLRNQDRTGHLNKIKIELPKYYGQDNTKAIMWVNKNEGIFSMSPPTNEVEKISMACLYLEGELTISSSVGHKKIKSNGLSMNWQNGHKGFLSKIAL
jgi:hypothetical protein